MKRGKIEKENLTRREHLFSRIPRVSRKISLCKSATSCGKNALLATQYTSQMRAPFHALPEITLDKSLQRERSGAARERGESKIILEIPPKRKIDTFAVRILRPRNFLSRKISKATRRDAPDEGEGRREKKERNAAVKMLVSLGGRVTLLDSHPE